MNALMVRLAVWCPTAALSTIWAVESWRHAKKAFTIRATASKVDARLRYRPTSEFSIYTFLNSPLISKGQGRHLLLFDNNQTTRHLQKHLTSNNQLVVTTYGWYNLLASSSPCKQWVRCNYCCHLSLYLHWVRMTLKSPVNTTGLFSWSLTYTIEPMNSTGNSLLKKVQYVLRWHSILVLVDSFVERSLLAHIH